MTQLKEHLHRQALFSLKTFGPGERRVQLLRALVNKADVVAGAEDDLVSWWTDVALIALDGLLRSTTEWKLPADPENMAEAAAYALIDRHAQNEQRDITRWTRRELGGSVRPLPALNEILKPEALAVPKGLLAARGRVLGDKLDDLGPDPMGEMLTVLLRIEENTRLTVPEHNRPPRSAPTQKAEPSPPAGGRDWLDSRARLKAEENAKAGGVEISVKRQSAHGVVTDLEGTLTVVDPHPLYDIAVERQRQRDFERHETADDDDFTGGELARMAACYANYAAEPEGRRNAKAGGVPLGWPMRPNLWKPKDRRRDLVRAGALIVAELERLDRMQQRIEAQAATNREIIPDTKGDEL